MKLFNLFKKQEAPDNLETGYICSVSHWDKHDQDIQKLLKELLKQEKLNDGIAWLSCQIVPEPSNKHDKNALKVLAYGKKWYDIGYIYQSDQAKVKHLMEYTIGNKYYFRIGFKYNQYNGVSLGLYFYQNKKSG